MDSNRKLKKSLIRKKLKNSMPGNKILVKKLKKRIRRK